MEIIANILKRHPGLEIEISIDRKNRAWRFLFSEDGRGEFYLIALDQSCFMPSINDYMKKKLERFEQYFFSTGPAANDENCD